MQIVPFAYKGTTIKTVEKGGEPWFVVKDVCDFFGVTNRNRIMQRVDPEDKGGTRLDTPGGIQDVALINESGLYAVLFALNPNNARGISEEEREAKYEKIRHFKRWVTHEVLPAIRKHGGYLTPEKVEEALLNPDTLIRLATDLKTERARRAELEAEAEANRPKVIFADAVNASKSTCLVGELAKILRGNGVQIGQNRLFEWMRQRGYLIARQGTDRNMPTQRSMELGLFEIKETAVTHSDGHVTLNRTPKVTGKGQTYFVNLFMKGAA